PDKRSEPWPPKWDEDFGFAADKYPVIATEIGFATRNAKVKEDYKKEIIPYLEGKGINWLWWVFDPDWGPPMFESWDTYKLTEGGEFFKKAVRGELTK
ncbi:MAG: glycoside hydrolase family 5 protein, partial [Ignavibacteriaceae bacterium]